MDEQELRRRLARVENALRALLAELARRADTHASIKELVDLDQDVYSLLTGER